MVTTYYIRSVFLLAVTTVYIPAGLTTENQGGTNSLDEFEDWLTWEPSDEIRQIFPVTRVGYDKHGSVVYVKEKSKWDYDHLAALPKEKQEEFWKYFETLVRLEERDARLNRDGQKNVLIYDFDGFRFNHNPSLEVQKLLEKQATFIDRQTKVTKNGFIINVNDDARAFVELVYPAMKDYVDKLELCDGVEVDEWKAKLLQQISASQLPPVYGGSNKNWKPLPVGQVQREIDEL